MRKLYVIVSYAGLSDEEVAARRGEIRDGVEEVTGEEFELLEPTPGLKRVASEVDAVIKADLVILAKNFQYSMPSRVVHFAASNYAPEMYEESWIDDQRAELAKLAEMQQEEEPKGVPDEDVPA